MLPTVQSAGMPGVSAHTLTLPSRWIVSAYLLPLVVITVLVSSSKRCPLCIGLHAVRFHPITLTFSGSTL